MSSQEYSKVMCDYEAAQNILKVRRKWIVHAKLRSNRFSTQ
jgi:hypothetical protein